MPLNMKALRECHGDVIDIYGYGVQVTLGLNLWREWLRELISSGKVRNLDLPVAFGQGHPKRPEAAYQYQRDFRYFLAVSDKDGTTQVIHRRSMVTLLCSAWEDRHRALIAKELGFKCKNELESDVFKDVNVYRRAIIHAGGKLRDEPKVFHFFRRGEVVSLTDDHIDTIFRRVVDELNRIGRDHYGADPQFNFDQPLWVGGKLSS